MTESPMNILSHHSFNIRQLHTMPPFSSIIILYYLTTWQPLSTHPFTYILLNTLPPAIFLLLIQCLLLFSALVILDHLTT